MDSSDPRTGDSDAGSARAASTPAPVTRTSYARRSLLWLLLPVAAGALLLGLHLAGEREVAADAVAVLPFAVTGNDDSTVALAEGIREGLARSLARLPGLEVIAASGGVPADPGVPGAGNAGRVLGARLVVTGRVDLQGDMLAVSAELSPVEGADRLWGGSFVRPADDLLAIEEELATQLARAVRSRPASASRAAPPRGGAGELAARHLYMKARFHARKGTAQGCEDAISCYRQAIHEAPTYALAYAGLAECYAVAATALAGAVPPRADLLAARAAAERALALDPELADAHAVLGRVKRLLDRDLAGAERSLRRAVELAPSSATARLWLGEVLAERGRPREAAEAFRRAARLDPLSPEPPAALARLRARH
jgi:TolB-like protein